jgi:hypothetical protein
MHWFAQMYCIYAYLRGHYAGSLHVDACHVDARTAVSVHPELCWHMRKTLADIPLSYSRTGPDVFQNTSPGTPPALVCRHSLFRLLREDPRQTPAPTELFRYTQKLCEHPPYSRAPYAGIPDNFPTLLAIAHVHESGREGQGGQGQ